jgi:hypothetical protein
MTGGCHFAHKLALDTFVAPAQYEVRTLHTEFTDLKEIKREEEKTVKGKRR